MLKRLFVEGNKNHTLENQLIDFWKWDKNFPSYKAVINPKNIVEKALSIHENIEYEEYIKTWDKYSLNNIVQIREFYKTNLKLEKENYKKNHGIANKAMINFIKKNIPYLVEYSDRTIIKVLSNIFDKHYPVASFDSTINSYKFNNIDADVFNFIQGYMYENNEKGNIL